MNSNPCSLRFFVWFWMLSVSALFLATSGGVRAETTNGIQSSVRERISTEMPALLDLYRHLHTHPELSTQEKMTSSRIAQELAKIGFELSTNVGGFGLVGVLRNGPGPTVLLRTDLDALPVKEQTGLPYASSVMVKSDTGAEVPVMHACGHDVHMSVFVGAARVLMAARADWRGTLVMIGEPAEERGLGAKAMLEDGLYSRFPKPDFCVALHVDSNLAAGKIGYVEGYATANVDSLNVTVRGVGGHGARPEMAKDPVVLAAQTVMALQTIVSREIKPGDPAVITVGSIHGGATHNVIPDEVKLQLTVRSFTDETRKQLLASIHRIPRGLALAAGMPEERMPIVEQVNQPTPAIYNNPTLTGRLAAAIKSWLGETNIVAGKPALIGEDFARYGLTPEKIPICMLGLGAVKPEAIQESEASGKPLPTLHSSSFAPQAEPAIRTGITALTAAVFELTSKR
jgi:amidohydrolase